MVVLNVDEAHRGCRGEVRFLSLGQMDRPDLLIFKIKEPLAVRRKPHAPGDLLLEVRSLARCRIHEIIIRRGAAPVEVGKVRLRIGPDDDPAVLVREDLAHRVVGQRDELERIEMDDRRPGPVPLLGRPPHLDGLDLLVGIVPDVHVGRGRLGLLLVFRLLGLGFVLLGAEEDARRILGPADGPELAQDVPGRERFVRRGIVDHGLRRRLVRVPDDDEDILLLDVSFLLRPLQDGDGGSGFVPGELGVIGRPGIHDRPEARRGIEEEEAVPRLVGGVHRIGEAGARLIEGEGTDVADILVAPGFEIAENEVGPAVLGLFQDLGFLDEEEGAAG